jgi:hypothetical protein
MKRTAIAAIVLIVAVAVGTEQARCAQPMPLDPTMGIPRCAVERAGTGLAGGERG